MANGIDRNFPTHALLPKKETGAWNFLVKYSNFDGRNTRIAILDSGIDPGASGLKVTTDGQPKILDLYDATGSGDVDTSKVVQVKDGVIVGLSGRNLNIPDSWSCPSGSYHIGLKAAFSIFPTSLKDRLKKERKLRDWDTPHNLRLAVAVKEKEALEKANATEQLESDKLLKDEKSAQVELLTNLEEKYTDYGPVFDCIVFHDGKTWRACVDTSEKGDLGSCSVMASYNEERQYATFSANDMLNYSFNIYDDGNVLEICTNTSTHGTHVAAITAAYEPDCVERNGIAPGAQLIGIKIGDSRLGTEETSAAIIRGMKRAIQWKCDLVNMSYGEPSRWTNDGRVIEIIKEASEKHGILFVTSAGNNGPALSTVGAPAHNTSVVAVGAYVTPEMMLAEYSMRETIPSATYTWSSRGPTLQGDFGVDICAPGGAITSVSNWTLCGQDMMNGTSMSSPNACGCLSTVLSGLKDRGIPYTTASIKRALINSAKVLDHVEPQAQGHGLIQVDKMFEYMSQFSNLSEDKISFDVSVNGKNGIYLREPHHFTNRDSEHIVKITPRFLIKSAAANSVDLSEQRSKIEFKMSLSIVGSEPWVNVPMYLELMNCDRSFGVKLSTGSLSPGLHSAQVLCYDSTCIDKGPLIRVPITVLIAEKVESWVNWQKTWRVSFSPGQINRHFVHVPAGATYATIRATPLSSTEPSTRVLIHAVQLPPNKSYREHEFELIKALDVNSPGSLTLPVKENTTLEVVVAKWWSSLGQAEIEYNVQFSGVKLPSLCIMHAGNSVIQYDVSADLKQELITPVVTFTTLVQTIRPSSCEIVPMTSSRDMLPDGRHVFSAILEYSFKMIKAGEVTPTCPLLCELLYESPLDSQMWMLFDSSKQHILSGDAYPIKYNYTTKLEPGEYTIKLKLQHEDKRVLETLKRTAMTLRHKLPSSINLDVYTSQKQAIMSGTKASNVLLPSKSKAALFFTSIPDDKLSKLPVALTPGMYLSGTISLLPESKSVTQAFHYVLCDPSKIPTNDKEKSSQPENKIDKQTEYLQAKLELDSKWITKLDSAEGMKLYKKLAEEHKYSNLTVQISALTLLEKQIQQMICSPNKSQTSSESEGGDQPSLADLVKEFFSITRAVLNDDTCVNKPELLTFLGIKNDSAEGSANRKSQMNKKRDNLVDVCLLNISLMSDLLVKKPDLDLDGLVTLELLQACWIEMIKFVDMSDKKVLKAYSKYARANGRLCLSANMIYKFLENGKDKEAELLLLGLVKELGWAHVEKNITDGLLVRYPPYQTLF